MTSAPRPGTRQPPSSAWKTKHSRLRQEAGVSSSPITRWSDHALLLGITTDRARDLLDIAFQIHQMTAGESVKCRLLCDVSQDAHRRLWSNHFRSLVKASTYYSFALDRCVFAEEHLRALGFPHLDLEGFSEHCLRDLAGEAMSAPAVGTVLMGILCSFPSDAGLWSS